MLSLFKEFNQRTALNKIDRAFGDQLERLISMIQKGKRNEEETRLWILDVIKTGLGYKNEDIETESKILGQRVDIALKSGGNVFMVIECKAATIKLNKAAVNQAATYAIGLGAEWAVVTNGQRWRLFHVAPTQGVEPDIFEIFDIALLDDDGISSKDIYFLSLLKPESIWSGATKKLYHEMNAISLKRIRDGFLTPEVVEFVCKKMEARYKRSMGVSVSITPNDIYPLMDKFFADAISAQED